MALDDALINPPLVRSVVVRFNLAIRYTLPRVWTKVWDAIHPQLRYLSPLSLSVAKNSLRETSPRPKLLTALSRIIENTKLLKLIDWLLFSICANIIEASFGSLLEKDEGEF